MSSRAEQYIESNRERFLEELKAFLRIPSVSTLPEHKQDIERASAFVAGKLRDAGMQKVERFQTAGHPLVYGEWMGAPGKPTVLCYGHYDVQPPDPLDEWITPPFEPAVRDENIYARGASDDKGQVYIHIKAVETLLKTAGKLPVNVKFLIEGEEEVGGAAVDTFVRQNPELLKCEVALVSDTELFAPGLPTLCVGLRGLVYTELVAQGAAQDLHSGMYGGAAPNPLMGLIRIISQLVSPEHRVLIPGFYDEVQTPSPEEMASWKRLPFDEKEFLNKEVGSERLTGESGYSVLERLWARPTLEVHGFVGGFQGEGAKTVIPAKAAVKVSMRLVPNQDPEKIMAAYRQQVERLTPPGLRVTVNLLSAAEPIVMSTSHPHIQAAARALTATFGRETVYIRAGGSIPIVARFQDSLHVPVVLMGFGLPDDRLHSPNEKFHIPNFFLGIRAVTKFWEEMADGQSN
ncbi:MAG: peptidase M20 [Acidobacteria bacterium RIFCSPLOWO2_12_FULL_54_10]|nr:MAG: peptidase M20 [Acidobacteria bacterium RIFCSPLOWO2_12_FULL_54_10]